MMTTPTLVINSELRDLLPPLTDEEFAGLEEKLLREGCTDPLKTWGNILIDGHNRYKICRKHGISFVTKSFDFQNIDEVKIWMWEHQKSQRNLTPFHRIEIAEKLRDIVAGTAKSRQRLSKGRGKKGCQNSDNLLEPVDTKKKLAAFAGVSHDTYLKGAFILEHCDDATKANLRNSKGGTSINKEFTRLKAEVDAQKPKKQRKTGAKSKATSQTTAADSATEKKETRPAEEKPKATTSRQAAEKPDPEPTATANLEETPVDPTLETITVTLKSSPKVNTRYCCGVKFDPDPDDNFFDWISDEEREELKARRKGCPNRIVPQIHSFTIQNIPEHKPDQLINCLFSLFKPLYREKLAFALLRTMAETETDGESAHNIVTTLFHEFQNR